MNRCPNCKSEDLEPVEHRVTIDVPDRDSVISFSVENVPGRRCTGCGEVYISGGDLQRAELLVAAELADRGIRSAGAFEHMMKTLSLRREDLIPLFDVAPDTRESGRAPVDRATWAAVTAMVSDRMDGRDTTLNRLRASHAPRAPCDPIVVEFPATPRK